MYKFISQQILQMRGRKSSSGKVQKDSGRAHLRNRFQICLATCRTSSSSVQHENTYKDPLAKYCYVPQPSSERHRRSSNSLNNNGDSPAVVVNSSSVVMLLTHLSPDCDTSYCPVNESYVDLSSYINIIYIKTILTLLSSPTIFFVLRYNSFITKYLKRRSKAPDKRRFEAPYIHIIYVYIRIFFPCVFQNLVSDGVLSWVVLL